MRSPGANVMGQPVTSLPPPPPPPPPPQPPSDAARKNFNTEITREDSTEYYNDKLQLALKSAMSLNENFSEIFYMSNIELKPQIQVGPKCGLVALSIATSACPVFVNVDKIFEKARSLDYTKQGEIFDVKYLADLAEKCCGFAIEIIKDGLHGHIDCIIRNLLKKNLLLIPYDADRNHSPCCKKGFKAHWAVISGFVIFSNSNSVDRVELDFPRGFQLCDNVQEPFPEDFKDIRLECVREGKLLVSKKNTSDLNKANDLSAGKIYLIGRQGKSKHVGVWPFDKMADSNDNLIFFSPDRNSDDYILPDGGLVEGLKSKAIILKRVNGDEQC